MAIVRHTGTTLRGFKDALRAMPLSVSNDVAMRAAPELTRRAKVAFLGGVNVYGDERPGGVSLMRTGTTFRTLRFVQSGTIVRCALGTEYAKYLIGKYKILPIGDRTGIPVAWVRALDDITAVAFAERAKVAA